MTYKYSICLILILILVYYVASVLAADDSALFKAELKSNTKTIAIEFTLRVKNLMVVDTAALPWLTPPELTFIVIPVGEGAGLRRVYFPQSLIIGSTTLKPGESYHGFIDLLPYFPDLAVKNVHCDLLFFWYWSTSRISGEKSGNAMDYSGCVFIPRNHMR